MEVRDLKEEIRNLIADVRSGRIDRNDAGVIIQAYRALKDLIVAGASDEGNRPARSRDRGTQA